MPPVIKNTFDKLKDKAESIVFGAMLTVIIGLLSAIYDSNTRAMEKIDSRTTSLEKSEAVQNEQLVRLYYHDFPNDRNFREGE